MSKIKNILIFLVIGVILVFVYLYFFKSTPEASLTSTSGNLVLPTTSATDVNLSIGKDFLTVLLNVKNIKLDDNIFSDLAFSSLHDSSILLIPDGTEGRPNPFAPIGSDLTASVVNSVDTNVQVPIVTPSTTSTNTTNTTSSGALNSTSIIQDLQQGVQP